MQIRYKYKSHAVIVPYQEAPVWFKPPATGPIYIPTGLSEGSVYYCDSVSNRMFIYEIRPWRIQSKIIGLIKRITNFKGVAILNRRLYKQHND